MGSPYKKETALKRARANRLTEFPQSRISQFFNAATIHNQPVLFMPVIYLTQEILKIL